MPNLEPQSTSPDGLTDEEVARRSVSEGFNELPRAERRTPLRIVFEVLREPMLVLLLGGGCVYLLLELMKPLARSRLKPRKGAARGSNDGSRKESVS